MKVFSILYTLKEIQLNIKFLNELNDSESLKRFALYIKLKSIFKTSCFYNFTYANLALKTGVSESTLKRNMSFFKSVGWVRIHSKNLIIEKIKIVDNEENGSRVSMRVSKKESYIDIYKRLRLCLVKDCQRRFEYAKKLTLDYNNGQRPGWGISLDNYKKAVKAARDFLDLGSIDEKEKFSISNFKVGKLIGDKSRSTASGLMTWGAKMKILSKQERIIVYNQNSMPKKRNNDMMVMFSPKSNNYIVQYANLVTFENIG